MWGNQRSRLGHVGDFKTQSAQNCLQTLSLKDPFKGQDRVLSQQGNTMRPSMVEDTAHMQNRIRSLDILRCTKHRE